VGDISKFNSIGSGKPTTGSTAEGLLIHEVVEEFGLQTSGVNLDDRAAVRARFETDHSAAISVEDKVNGNFRDRDLERNDRGNRSPLSPTYTRFVKEKNGTYTIESTTTGTKEMKVIKRNVVN